MSLRPADIAMLDQLDAEIDELERSFAEAACPGDLERAHARRGALLERLGGEIDRVEQHRRGLEQRMDEIRRVYLTPAPSSGARATARGVRPRHPNRRESHARRPGHRRPSPTRAGPSDDDGEPHRRPRPKRPRGPGACASAGAPR